MNKDQVVANTIFLTVAGSRAYGTHNEDSDTDVRGVCIPNDKPQAWEYTITYEVGVMVTDEDLVKLGCIILSE